MSRPRLTPPKPIPTTRRSTNQGLRIGLALGGGGARGLAHIPVIEALDEMGLRPSLIVGTSIGAIYGAAYASGLTGAYIRAHTEEVLGQRFDLIRQLFTARAGPVSHFLNLLPIRTSLLNAESLMDLLLPARVARNFADLQTPMQIVATDFYAQAPKILSAGALRPAVAASMALPALFSPVLIYGRPMVDGGLVNPLPFDLLRGLVDVTIAVDVSGARKRDDVAAAPSAIEVLMASSQIFQHTIVQEKLKAAQPDIYLDCPVAEFSVLDFHKFKDVFAAVEPVKEHLKRQLGAVLASSPARTLAAPTQPFALPAPAAKPSKRRR